MTHSGCPQPFKMLELLLFLPRARPGTHFTPPGPKISPFHQKSSTMSEIPLIFIKVGKIGVNRVPGGATRPRSSQNVTIIKRFAASRAAYPRARFQLFCFFHVNHGIPRFCGIAMERFFYENHEKRSCAAARATLAGCAFLCCGFNHRVFPTDVIGRYRQLRFLS